MSYVNKIVLAITAFIVTLLVSFFATACVTPPAPLVSCETAVPGMLSPTTSAGFKLAQQQAEALGELAVFVKDATARLYYVTPSKGAADFLAGKGWTQIGECKSADQTVYVVTRDIEIPLSPGDKA